MTEDNKISDEKQKNITIKNLIDKIPIFIPLVLAYLTILSTIKLIIYYTSFGISIVEYLEFTEILTAFLDDIFIHSISFLIVFGLLNNFGHGIFKKKTEEKKNTDDKIKKVVKKRIQGLIGEMTEDEKESVVVGKNLFQRSRIWLLLLPRKLKLFLFFLGAVYIFCFIMFSPTIESIILALLSLLMMGILFLVLIDNSNYSQIKEKSADKVYLQNIISFLVLIIIGIVSTAFVDVISTKYNKTYAGTLFQLDNNSVIVSDENSYYIGKTNNYIFYHKSKEKKTIVYPMSRVKWISFGKDNEKKQSKKQFNTTTNPIKPGKKKEGKSPPLKTGKNHR